MHTAAMAINPLFCSLPHGDPGLFVGKQAGQLLEQGGRINGFCAASGNQILGNFRKIFHVRPEQDRYPVNCGLNRVMSSLPDKAAPDKGEIGPAVTGRKFPQGIKDKHITVDRPAAPGAGFKIKAAGQLKQFAAATDITRCHNQKEIFSLGRAPVFALPVRADTQVRPYMSFCLSA